MFISSSKNVATISTNLNSIVTPNFPTFFGRVVSNKKSKKTQRQLPVTVKAADKGGAVVVWGADPYQKEALRQLSDTSFCEKVDKGLTFINHNVV